MNPSAYSVIELYKKRIPENQHLRGCSGCRNFYENNFNRDNLHYKKKTIISKAVAILRNLGSNKGNYFRYNKCRLLKGEDILIPYNNNLFPSIILIEILT